MPTANIAQNAPHKTFIRSRKAGAVPLHSAICSGHRPAPPSGATKNGMTFQSTPARVRPPDHEFKSGKSEEEFLPAASPALHRAVLNQSLDRSGSLSHLHSLLGHARVRWRLPTMRSSQIK